jgi:hypothetical protein
MPSALAVIMLMAGPMRSGLDVSVGSKPVLTAPKHHFRSTLINGHYRTGPVGPARAIPGQLDGGRGGLPLLVRGPFDCAAIFAVRHHAVLCA